MTFMTMAHSHINWNRVGVSGVFILFAGVIGLLFFLMTQTYEDRYIFVSLLCFFAAIITAIALFCATDMLIKQGKKLIFALSCTLTGIAGALIYTHWF